MNLSDLRAWRPEALIATAQVLTDVGSAAQTVAATSRDRVLDADGFDGRTATAAEAAVSAAHRDASRVGLSVLACVDALHEAATTLMPTRDAALDVVDEAGQAGRTVTDTGEVVAPEVTVGDPVLDLVFADRLRARAAALQERLSAALLAVVDADRRAADRRVARRLVSSRRPCANRCPRCSTVEPCCPPNRLRWPRSGPTCRRRRRTR